MGKKSSKSDGRYSEKGWLALKERRRTTGARSIGKKMQQLRARKTSAARPSRPAAEGHEGAGGPPTIPSPIVPEEVPSTSMMSPRPRRQAYETRRPARCPERLAKLNANDILLLAPYLKKML